MNIRPLRPSRQRGATIIEAVLSLAILAIMAVGFGTAVSSSQRNLKLTGAASELATLRAAGDRYIQDNFTTLVTSAATGPVAVPIANLAAGNYLPPSFPTMNAYGQTYQLYVYERSPTVLESLALTTGGTALSSGDGGRMALLLKGAGGYTPAGSTTINGTNGGWSAPLATYVPAGSPAPSGTPAAYSIEYAVYGPTGALIRYATGNPVDNQMQTAINMNGNNINNAGTIGASTVTATTVNATTATGQTANFTTGNITTVNSSASNTGTASSTAAYTSTLQVYGQTTANQISANSVSLPAGNSLSIGGTYYYGDGSNGAVRNPGGFYVQDIYGNTRWNTDGSGNTWQGGNADANTIQMRSVQSAGVGCGTWGQQAIDGGGNLLSCSWGQWTYPGAGNGKLRNAGGNNFYCDPEYNLVAFHYDCGCTNNANWYECQSIY